MLQEIQRARELADAIEQFSYMKPFCEEEIAELKDNLADVSISIRKKEDELKILQEPIKEEISKMKKSQSGILDYLRDKARNVVEECFIEYDHENNRAVYRSSQNGAVVYTRPLKVDELNRTIKFKKDGTND